jgi:uncharacterized protein YegL
MKTRIIAMIVLTIAALALLLGLKIGREDSNTDVVEQLTPSDTLTIKRVYNLIILDESGSMDGLQEVSVSGVNETLQTIRNAYEEYPQQEQFVTFATFSGEPRRDEKTCRVRRDLQSITEIQNLDLSEFNPNGLTPLWDTMGKLLTELETKVSEDELVLVTIITDGCENSSIKYDSEKIKQLVTRLDEKGWIFTYIGANQDVSKVATEMGIGNYYLYVSDKKNTKRMFARERKFRLRFYKSSRYWEQSGVSKEELRKKLQEGYFEEGSED